MKQHIEIEISHLKHQLKLAIEDNKHSDVIWAIHQGISSLERLLHIININ